MTTESATAGDRGISRRTLVAGAGLAAGGAAAPALAAKHRHKRHRKPHKPPTGVRSSTAEQPDVVVFLTDDMRADDWPILRQAQERIGGTWLSNFCFDVAVCGPTRATLFSGQMAHHHGVRDNGNAYQKFRSHEAASLAPAIQAAGYHAAYVGKYLNEYDGKRKPPGWDDWGGMAMPEAGKTSYKPHGTYTTTAVTRRAVSAAVSAPSDKPLFLFVSHHAPHSPSIPAKGYAKADVGPVRNGKDRARKRCLLSVDDSIAAVADAMGDRWASAIVLALSDNGYLLGEHGTTGKAIWWDQAERVPMLARLPGLHGATDGRMTSTIDVCPTLLRATGATATWPVDGLALQDDWERDSVLIAAYQSRSAGDEARTPFAGLKGDGWVYVEPRDKPARYYADPDEADDVIATIDPAPFHQRLADLLDS